MTSSAASPARFGGRGFARSRSRRCSRPSTPSSSSGRRSRRRGAARTLRSASRTRSGGIGLLERENATIMNACLRELAAPDRRRLPRGPAELGHRRARLPQPERRHADGRRLRRALPGGRPSPPARRTRCAARPSSPASHDCAVVDIGGTTSDVGMLQHGFPREASIAVEVGGVRTNFRMPDVLSLGIGGGSRRRATASDGRARSQCRLRAAPQRALVFGGDDADRDRHRGRRRARRDRRPGARRRPRPCS